MFPKGRKSVPLASPLRISHRQEYCTAIAGYLLSISNHSHSSTPGLWVSSWFGNCLNRIQLNSTQLNSIPKPFVGAKGARHRNRRHKPEQKTVPALNEILCVFPPKYKIMNYQQSNLLQDVSYLGVVKCAGPSW